MKTSLFGLFVLTQASDTVSYKSFDLDSEVKDILWCGPKDETILVLSEVGTVYRSNDKGKSWKKMVEAFE